MLLLLLLLLSGCCFPVEPAEIFLVGECASATMTEGTPFRVVCVTSPTRSVALSERRVFASTAVPTVRINDTTISSGVRLADVGQVTFKCNDGNVNANANVLSVRQIRTPIFDWRVEVRFNQSVEFTWCESESVTKTEDFEISYCVQLFDGPLEPSNSSGNATEGTCLRNELELANFSGTGSDGVAGLCLGERVERRGCSGCRCSVDLDRRHQDFVVFQQFASNGVFVRQRQVDVLFGPSVRLSGVTELAMDEATESSISFSWLPPLSTRSKWGKYNLMYTVELLNNSSVLANETIGYNWWKGKGNIGNRSTWPRASFSGSSLLQPYAEYTIRVACRFNTSNLLSSFVELPVRTAAAAPLSAPAVIEGHFLRKSAPGQEEVVVFVGEIPEEHWNGPSVETYCRWKDKGTVNEVAVKNFTCTFATDSFPVEYSVFGKSVNGRESPPSRNIIIDYKEQLVNPSVLISDDAHIITWQNDVENIAILSCNFISENICSNVPTLTFGRGYLKRLEWPNGGGGDVVAVKVAPATESKDVGRFSDWNPEFHRDPLPEGNTEVIAFAVICCTLAAILVVICIVKLCHSWQKGMQDVKIPRAKAPPNSPDWSIYTTITSWAGDGSSSGVFASTASRCDASPLKLRFSPTQEEKYPYVQGSLPQCHSATFDAAPEASSGGDQFTSVGSSGGCGAVAISAAAVDDGNDKPTECTVFASAAAVTPPCPQLSGPRTSSRPYDRLQSVAGGGTMSPDSAAEPARLSLSFGHRQAADGLPPGSFMPPADHCYDMKI